MLHGELGPGRGTNSQHCEDAIRKPLTSPRESLVTVCSGPTFKEAARQGPVFPAAASWPMRKYQTGITGMTDSTGYEKPRWLRDLVRFLPLKSQFVLSGNVRDLQISETTPGIFAAVPLSECLHRE